MDKHITLDRAADDLLGVTMQIEGISASLRVLAADLDGERVISDLDTARLLGMLATSCDAVTHRLGIVHDMIEAAAEGREEGAENG